jgi:ABC-type transport system involved in multi-copper enzyme maturation permease subunit
MNRITHVAANTFREAVRDRIFYNLVLFALLMVGSAPLLSQISIGLERIFLVNLGLTAIEILGVMIAIFFGTGLVAKEIERRTLYTVLSRPVRRWEFIVGKYLGLSGTLLVNASFMALGLFAAVWYASRGISHADATLLIAIYFIALQFLVITAITLLFSTFTTPLFTALFAFAIYVIGSFAEDLRGFAQISEGAEGWLALGISYLVPNFGAMNVISEVAHGESVPLAVIAANSAYAIFYSVAAIAAAILIFERRDLK